MSLERIRVFSFLLIAPVALSLVYFGGLMYPMLVPKTLALRGLGIIASAAFLYLATSGTPFFWSRLKDWRAWIPGALLVSAYISSLFGIDFSHSFWSTFERGDGLLTLTVCVGYFYLILLAADDSFVRKMLCTIAWVGSIVGFYVLVQWLDLALGLNLPFIAEANGRIGGTMGNAAFLAAYLGITFFITRAVRTEYTGSTRWFLTLGSFAQLLGIVLTATRGTELALIVVGVLVLCYQSLQAQGRAGQWARYALGGVFILLVLFGIFRSQFAQVPIDAVQRLASISLSDATVSSRIFLWSKLTPEALQAPLLGVGDEQIATIFNRVYDPTMIVEEWFDRSHNAYLDHLLAFGLVGLALYLVLIGIGLWESWRMRTQNKYAPYLLLAILTYALQNFFVFDTGVTLWLMLALVAVVLAEALKGEKSSLTPTPLYQWGGRGVALVLLLLLIPVVITPLRANRLAFNAYLYHVVDVAKTKAFTDAGLSLNTYADLEFGYNAYFMYTQEQLTMLKGQDLITAWQTAHGVLRRNYERYPYDARTITYLLHILDSAPEGVTVDITFEQQAITRDLDLSPKRSEAWYILANLSISLGNTYPVGPKRTALYENAVKTLQEYLKLVPTLSEPHFVLADIYKVLGDNLSASREAALGKQYYKPDVLTARRAAGYYVASEDWASAEFFLKEVVREKPTDYASEYDLAKVEYLNGDPASALIIFKRLQHVAPSIIADDPNFLAAITAYEQSAR